ncbi:hypothetical protein ABG768_022811, partial [Culter alburnus]
SGKFRHRLRRKIAESKRLLLKDIETYNSLPCQMMLMKWSSRYQETTCPQHGCG